jgi:hypothetical protein
MKTYIGFTGTQKGMTAKQQETVKSLLSEHQEIEFHHGDCIGADEEAHKIARAVGARVVLHPPIKKDKRANCSADDIKPAKDFLDRNKDIVDATTILIATPDGVKEKVHSGTWSTVRYARKEGRKLFVVLPDGSVL